MISTLTTAEARIQASEYTLPYHWIGMDHNCLLRYVRLSVQIGELIRHHAEPGRGLDIGCGDGRSTYEVAEVIGPDYQLIGTDYDARAIHFARFFAPEVEFQVADATGELPAEDGSLAFVYSREVLEHIPPDQVARFLTEQERVLQPGGIVVVTVPSRRLKTPAKHFQHFDQQTLRRVFSAFEELAIFGFGHRPRGLLLGAIYQLLDRCPGLWRLYQGSWEPTTPDRGDILVGCFRKKSKD